MAGFWNNRFLVLGLALWFALVFGAFPVTEPSLVMGDSYGDDKPVLLNLAYSGVLAAVVLPIISSKVRLDEHLLGLMVCACGMQYLGTAMVVGVAVNPTFASFVGGLFYGSGNFLAIFAWGTLLVRCKDDVRESVFIASIPLAGLFLLLGDLIFSDHSLASLLLFPIASLACYWKAQVGVPELEENPASVDAAHILRGIMPELFKLALVFGLVGFIWQQYAMDTSVGAFEKGVLFSLGFILAAMALHLFVQYSSGMGVGSFVRWTFPIIAVGLMCASMGSAFLASVACVLFAGAHAALEAMMRIRAIGMARKFSANKSAFVLACGFAAISVGAATGETLFNVMKPVISADGYVPTIMIFTVLVLVEALIPETTGPAVQRVEVEGHEEKAPTDSERKAAAMAGTYALSAREREVLVLLLDGRSGPVIRETLGLSKSTIDTHIRHIYQKAGVATRQELIDLSQSE